MTLKTMDKVKSKVIVSEKLNNWLVLHGAKKVGPLQTCLDLLVKNKYQLESSFKRVFLEYDWPKRFLE